MGGTISSRCPSTNLPQPTPPPAVIGLPSIPRQTGEEHHCICESKKDQE